MAGGSRWLLVRFIVGKYTLTYNPINILFQFPEHLAVSSRGSWEWQWVPAPRNRAGLVLELRAQGAAHVALSDVEEPSDDMYRVVFERTRVWIAKGKHGKLIIINQISLLFKFRNFDFEVLIFFWI